MIFRTQLGYTPVKVTGNVKNGFTDEFEPIEAGIHKILVEYNGLAVGGNLLYSNIIRWIPTSVGTNSAVNLFLTLPVTLTGVRDIL